MRVHVINLDRTPERFSAFAAANPRLSDVSRYSAVDGRHLDMAGLVARGLVASDVLTTYSRNALGCTLSHVGLWTAAIEANRVLTVAEDDAIFNRDFERLAEGALRELPPEWDIVLWGFNFDGFMSFEMLPGVSYCLGQFDQRSLRAGIAAFRELPLSPRLFRLRWAFGTICYSISPKGAKLFRNGLCPLRPMIAAIPEGERAKPGGTHFGTVGPDNAMCTLYPRLNAFVSMPPLVVSRNETATSTVQNA
ncbi:MAG: glycosyltransferase family 25 protein [Stellaceae bacterium]